MGMLNLAAENGMLKQAGLGIAYPIRFTICLQNDSDWLTVFSHTGFQYSNGTRNQHETHTLYFITEKPLPLVVEQKKVLPV
jgi:hypothetical protein